MLFLILICPAMPQEVGLTAGINKIGFHPFYRTASETYRISVQSCLQWELFSGNSHQFLLGGIAAYHHQPVFGDQWSLSGRMLYRYSKFAALSPELGVGVGGQL
jgi:hypothetical protein